METVISRGVANTRLRDYYDLYILQNQCPKVIDIEKFQQAFFATNMKRNSIHLMRDGECILHEISGSEVMQGLWKNYQKKFSYAEDISWKQVMEAVHNLYDKTNIKEF